MQTLFVSGVDLSIFYKRNYKDCIFPPFQKEKFTALEKIKKIVEKRNKKIKDAISNLEKNNLIKTIKDENIYTLTLTKAAQKYTKNTYLKIMINFVGIF